MKNYASTSFACMICSCYITRSCCFVFFFFFQAENGIRDRDVTGVQTCALPISIAMSINEQHESWTLRQHSESLALKQLRTYLWHTVLKGVASWKLRYTLYALSLFILNLWLIRLFKYLLFYSVFGQIWYVVSDAFLLYVAVPKEIKQPMTKYYTTGQAATILGVCIRAVQLWVEDCRIDSWKTSGGHRRLSRESVHAHLNSERLSNALTTDPSPHTTTRQFLIVDDSKTDSRLITRVILTVFPDADLAVAAWSQERRVW